MRPPPSSLLEPLQIVEALVADRERYLSFVRNRVRTPDIAEDILQVGLTKAFERANTLRDGGALSGWFFQILRNEIVDQARRSSTQEKTRQNLTLEAEHFSPAREREVASCQCVGHAKNALKAEFAEILDGVEVEGLPVKTFAERHGLSASAAGVRVHRARKALLDQVQKTCGACASEGCLDCTCQRSDAACDH